MVDNPVPKVVVVPGVGERITDVIELGRVVPELFTERVRPAMPGSAWATPMSPWAPSAAW